VDFVRKWLEGKDPTLAPHLLLVGRTGSGKTSAAKVILSHAIRNALHKIVILDWDGEYVDLPLPIHVPPFEVRAPPQLIADSLALAEVEHDPERGYVVAHLLYEALSQGGTLERAMKYLRAVPLREAAYAYLHVLTIMPYIAVSTPYDPRELTVPEGVYNLSLIGSMWERTAVQHFLASLTVLARPVASYPHLLLVIEEGVEVRTTFLKNLVASAGKRNVKVIFITQTLTPLIDIIDNFEFLLFDCDPSMRRALHAAIPNSKLKPGECWWVRRDGFAKKFYFKL